MHDTHLIEKIFQAAAALCRQNKISRVITLEIEVGEGSHIEEGHLLSHLIERDGALFGGWTTVRVEKRPHEKLTAIIRRIDGDARE